MPKLTLWQYFLKMGYYLYHDKFTLERPLNGFGHDLSKSSFIANELALFEQFFQKVPVKTRIDSIILCNTQKELDAEKQRLHDKNGIFLTSDIGSIEKFIAHKKYTSLIKEETILFDNRRLITFYDVTLVEGYFSITIFEHPFKDYTPEFSKKYKPGINYYSFDAFKDAAVLEYSPYRFLDKKDFENTQQLFEHYLIEKYQFGESRLCYL